MSSHFSLLTLNTYFDTFQCGARYAAQIALFARLQPHAIALQEVNAALLAAIASAPGLAAYELCAPTLRRSFYGTALLVKRELAPAFSRRELPTDMGRELLLANLVLPGGARLCLATVHLESLNNSDLRRLQLEASRALIGPGAAVLCGDFNFCSRWNFREMQAAGGVGEAAAAAAAAEDEERGEPRSKRFAFSPLPMHILGGGAGDAEAAAAAPQPLSPPLPPPQRQQSPLPPPLENACLGELFPDFVDAWPAAHPLDPGFTFDTTRNPMITSGWERMRYDRVLFRMPHATLQSVELIGTEPLAADPAQAAGGGGGSGASSATPARQPPPVLLSDHFGLLATWRLDS
jgi:endonuclease/exonuclease/phosphatase family metal-dependent hydrolase